MAVPAVAVEQELIPISTVAGVHSELMLVHPAGASVTTVLYWLAAMGVPARHYLPLAEALARRGIAVALHEWRGIGSSDQRAGRHCDWSYRDLLTDDIPAGQVALRKRYPQASYWLGGHSLGGQLACLYASLYPSSHTGIALVASGAPYWRMFRWRPLLLAAYALAPPLARLVGRLPGRTIGFGGNEARGVVADWARSGRSGRYTASGMSEDFEQRLAALRLPVLGLRMRDDWLVPAASLDWLLGKMPQAACTHAVIAAEDQQGHSADHFSWMKQPGVVASRIADGIDARGVFASSPSAVS